MSGRKEEERGGGGGEEEDVRKGRERGEGGEYLNVVIESVSRSYLA